MKLDTLSSNPLMTKLIDLLKKFNVRWITSTKTNEVLILLPDLSHAKGEGSNGFLTHAKGFPGVVHRLQGAALDRFKEAYEKEHGTPFGDLEASQVWVCDWKRFFSYGIQGRSEFALELQSLGGVALMSLSECEIIDPAAEQNEPVDCKETEPTEQLVEIPVEIPVTGISVTVEEPTLDQAEVVTKLDRIYESSPPVSREETPEERSKKEAEEFFEKLRTGRIYS